MAHSAGWMLTSSKLTGPLNTGTVCFNAELRGEDARGSPHPGQLSTSVGKCYSDKSLHLGVIRVLAYGGAMGGILAFWVAVC